jgi:hypothetical protein
MNEDELKIYDEIISELKNNNIKYNDKYDTVGIGDVVEEVLNKFGVTEERFKSWFNLKACDCEMRKKWLNGLFSWRRLRKN